MMNYVVIFIFTIFLSSASILYAQTPSVGEMTYQNEVHPKEHKKKAEKNVKTNGKISTSGCETAAGKTLAENDFGYEDCVKQIGLKKKSTIQ